MPDTFGWMDIEDIVLAMDEAYPDLDPLSVRFTDLREMVEKLNHFKPEPGHNVNEQILEAIQAGWHEERQEQAALDREEDDQDEDGYEPNRPFH